MTRKKVTLEHDAPQALLVFALVVLVLVMTLSHHEDERAENGDGDQRTSRNSRGIPLSAPLAAPPPSP